jgi:hypothetical protein
VKVSGKSVTAKELSIKNASALYSSLPNRMGDGFAIFNPD